MAGRGISVDDLSRSHDEPSIPQRPRAWTTGTAPRGARALPPLKPGGRPRLFVCTLSAPSRAAWLLCRATGLDVDVHKVDAARGFQYSETFSHISPLSKAPALDAGDVTLWEGNSILRHLCRANPVATEGWYPVDLAQRARIDQLLDWSRGELSRVIFEAIQTMLLDPLVTPISDDIPSSAYYALPDSLSNHLIVEMDGCLTLLDKYFLGNHQFIAGDAMSIADLAVVTQIVALDLIAHDMSPYKHIVAWRERMETVEGWNEVNELFHNVHHKMALGHRRMADPPTAAGVHESGSHGLEQIREDDGEDDVHL